MKTPEDAIDELREELAKLRERVAKLESRGPYGVMHATIPVHPITATASQTRGPTFTVSYKDITA